MKTQLLRNSIIAGALCTVLAVPSFIQASNVAPKPVEDIVAVPISYKFDHWAETYIDQLLKKFDVELVFKDKSLDAVIAVEDFKKLVNLIIDEKYHGAPDAMTREAVVYELSRIWAEKTGKNLENVPTIRMLVYSDTSEIDAKYNHSATVAYMKDIAKGKGDGIFAPKDFVTYGELAALMNNTYKAIEDELMARIEGFGSKLDYANFSVGDIDGDGVFELVSIARVSKEIPSVKLQVHSFTDDSYKLEYETKLQYGEYPDDVIIGSVSENQKGIFVEMGLGAHSAITEIVIKENGEYKNPLAHKDEYDFSQTFKPYPLYSQDINHDGIIEVGVQIEPLEANGYSMASMPWINNWYQWDGKGGLTKVMEEYSSYSEGYRFVIPKSWSDKFTIDKVTDESYAVNSVQFIYLAANKERAELLVLHHVPKADWPQKEEEFKKNNQSYVLLGENSQNMLVAELKQNGEKLSGESLNEYEKLLLNRESIISRFVAIGDNTKIINAQSKYPKTEKGIIKPEYARGVIKETADKLIHAISTKDTETISELIHPVKGVRFTPYTHVSLEQDVVFDKESTKKFFADQEAYLWGNYDGTGDEISLTPSRYYEKFIYSEDFINAEAIGYNEVLSSGNMLENQFEVYEDPIVVEYYFSGLEPQYEGMDWKSLRLVFEQYEGNWKLTGIIHNQWTI